MRHTKMQWKLGFVTFTGEVAGRSDPTPANTLAAMAVATRTKLGSAWHADADVYE